MKKLIFSIMLLATAGMAVSCDGGGDDKKKDDSTTLKTARVVVYPDYSVAGNREGAAGDVLYICNRSVGTKGLVYALRYDAQAGCFSGNVDYLAATDNFYAYVKYANTPKVTVDTAARTVRVDYQNQSGTLADAQARDFGSSNAISLASLTSETGATVRFYSSTAYVVARKADGVSVGSYRLSAYLNKTPTKALAKTEMFVADASVSMLSGSVGAGSDEKIVCAPQASGNTYIAFYATTIEKPMLEADVTLASGVNIIENEKLYGSDGNDYVSYSPAQSYAKDITGEVSVGSFLCDANFNVKAIIFDVDNVSEGDYHTARAMAVDEAADGQTVEWSNRSTLPSSMSKYVTSNVMTDMQGYAFAEYYRGTSDYTALALATSSEARLNGCSEWYLPSSGEWMNFWNNLGGKDGVNSLLKQAGAAELGGVKYWTATLRSLTEPCVVSDNGSSLSALPQPLRSKNAVRAAVVF